MMKFRSLTPMEERELISEWYETFKEMSIYGGELSQLAAVWYKDALEENYVEPDLTWKLQDEFVNDTRMADGIDGKDCYGKEKADAEQIAEAEKELGVTFPDGFKWMVTNFPGFPEVTGGILFDLKTCVKETLEARKSDLPEHLILLNRWTIEMDGRLGMDTQTGEIKKLRHDWNANEWKEMKMAGSIEILIINHILRSDCMDWKIWLAQRLREGDGKETSEIF